VNLYWIVAFREVDLQIVATARRLCERTMTSKLDQELSPMAATRLIDEFRGKPLAPRLH
jgi:hypothetical protein